MKESRLMITMLLAFGLVFAPVVVLAEEGKIEEGNHSAHHDAKGEHAHGGMKTEKKNDSPKAQAVSEKAAAHPHGDQDGDEEEDEGSH